MQLVIKTMWFWPFSKVLSRYLENVLSHGTLSVTLVFLEHATLANYKLLIVTHFLMECSEGYVPVNEFAEWFTQERGFPVTLPGRTALLPNPRWPGRTHRMLHCWESPQAVLCVISYVDFQQWRTLDWGVW